MVQNRLVYTFVMMTICLAAICIEACQGCGEDCPGDCEDKYKCVDRSELCAQMKDQCENFFFRKCMRCACPKTCGICGDSSSSESEEETTMRTTPSSTPSSTTMNTTMASSTTNATQPPPSTTEEPSTSEEPSSSPAPPSTEEAPSSPPPSPSTPEPIESTTVEEISDADFSDPVKMKCKSCDAKRKKLAEIYDKYYPKE